MSPAAVLAGGNVRVGLEDNLWLEKGVLAENYQLVGTRAHDHRDHGRHRDRPTGGAREIGTAQAGAKVMWRVCVFVLALTACAAPALC